MSFPNDSYFKNSSRFQVESNWNSSGGKFSAERAVSGKPAFQHIKHSGSENNKKKIIINSPNIGVQLCASPRLQQQKNTMPSVEKKNFSAHISELIAQGFEIYQFNGDKLQEVHSSMDVNWEAKACNNCYERLAEQSIASKDAKIIDLAEIESWIRPNTQDVIPLEVLQNCEPDAQSQIAYINDSKKILQVNSCQWQSEISELIADIPHIEFVIHPNETAEEIIAKLREIPKEKLTSIVLDIRHAEYEKISDFLSQEFPSDLIIKRPGETAGYFYLKQPDQSDLEKMQQVDALEIVDCDLSEICFLSIDWPHLKKISIDGATRLSEDQLIVLLERSPNLECLEIGTLSLSGRFLKHLPKTLQSLKLDKINWLDPEHIERVDLPCLTNFTFKASRPEDLQAIPIIASCQETLRTLKVLGSNPELFRNWGYLAGLQEIALDLCPEPVSLVLQQVGDQLQKLKLVGTSLGPVSDKMKNITFLELRNCLINNPTIESIVSAIPKLKNLWMHKNRILTIGKAPEIGSLELDEFDGDEEALAIMSHHIESTTKISVMESGTSSALLQDIPSKESALLNPHIDKSLTITPQTAYFEMPMLSNGLLMKAQLQEVRHLNLGGERFSAWPVSISELFCEQQEQEFSALSDWSIRLLPIINNLMTSSEEISDILSLYPGLKLQALKARAANNYFRQASYISKAIDSGLGLHSLNLKNDIIQGKIALTHTPRTSYPTRALPSG